MFWIKEQIIPLILTNYEAIRGEGHKRLTVKATGCGFVSHSRKLNNKYLYFFALELKQRLTLSSARQHSMPLEFGGKWETEVGTMCHNTRFPGSSAYPKYEREAKKHKISSIKIKVFSHRLIYVLVI